MALITWFATAAIYLCLVITHFTFTIGIPTGPFLRAVRTQTCCSNNRQKMGYHGKYCDGSNPHRSTLIQLQAKQVRCRCRPAVNKRRGLAGKALYKIFDKSEIQVVEKKERRFREEF